MEPSRVYITGFEKFVRFWICLVIVLSLAAAWYAGKKFGGDEIRNELILYCKRGDFFYIVGREGLYQCRGGKE